MIAVRDPLAEKYASFSPYGYALNNPVIFIDPDGMAMMGLFFFFATNTMVEWMLEGYNVNGEAVYALGTYHYPEAKGFRAAFVGSFQNMSKYGFSSFNLRFQIHSHFLENNVRGPSSEDYYIVREQYNKFRKAGMGGEIDDLYSSFTTNTGIETIFPRYFVFQRATKDLYFYGVYPTNSFIHNIGNFNSVDSFFNLNLGGF